MHGYALIYKNLLDLSAIRIVDISDFYIQNKQIFHIIIVFNT